MPILRAETDSAKFDVYLRKIADNLNDTQADLDNIGASIGALRGELYESVKLIRDANSIILKVLATLKKRRHLSVKANQK